MKDNKYSYRISELEMLFQQRLNLQLGFDFIDNDNHYIKVQVKPNEGVKLHLLNLFSPNLSLTPEARWQELSLLAFCELVSLLEEETPLFQSLEVMKSPQLKDSTLVFYH